MTRRFTWFGLLVGAGLLVGGPALAQNQTPTVSSISLDDSTLPFTVHLERVDTGRVLPTLQSFASGTVDGLWVIIGGRTNGLHSFTNDPVKNFPPAAQNRRVWVIDPANWRTWSRPLSDSRLSLRLQQALSSTATESAQSGDTLYVVGGYGFLRAKKNFITFPNLTSIDLRKMVAWVKRESGAVYPAQFVRTTTDPALRVTGGELTIMYGKRAILAFGQTFTGGYGGPHSQVYTGQVRNFTIDETTRGISIRNVERKPLNPNYNDFRRRDYNLLPIIDIVNGERTNAAVAQSGVFTLTNGVWTVPVEIDRNGLPTMADPTLPSTFKQGMNSYNTASFTLFDTLRDTNYMMQFGGISYEFASPSGIKANAMIPFINDATTVIRRADGTYRQVLLGDARYPPIIDKAGKRLHFGAEASVFFDPLTPRIGNGLVDLRGLLAQYGTGDKTIGYIFGGIAADAPNDGNSTASNEVFAIKIGPRRGSGADGASDADDNADAAQ